MRYTTHSTAVVNTQKGFTLIELIVVFSVVGLISVLGIASFVEYSRTQAVATAAAEVETVLQTARSRATSQIKPSSCEDKQLEGYQVVVTSTTAYELQVVCNGIDYTVDARTLGENLSFSSLPTFYFHILSAGVSGAGVLEIDGYGKTKSITVTTTGSIAVE